MGKGGERAAPDKFIRDLRTAPAVLQPGHTISAAARGPTLPRADVGRRGGAGCLPFLCSPHLLLRGPPGSLVQVARVLITLVWRDKRLPSMVLWCAGACGEAMAGGTSGDTSRVPPKPGSSAGSGGSSGEEQLLSVTFAVWQLLLHQHRIVSLTTQINQEMKSKRVRQGWSPA